jgi:glycosyltransferase A (GT-A) superfamily protein (DUF2064 family)
VVALDGDPGPWLPPGFEVVPQSGGRLDQRLASAWDAVGGPGVQIGMDTPQVTPDVHDAALGALDTSDAVLGHAPDGGWWAIGLQRADPSVFLGVAMSTSRTGRDQHARLWSLGLKVAPLPTLVDLDTVADLAAVTASGAARCTAALAARLGLPPRPEAA